MQGQANGTPCFVRRRVDGRHEIIQGRLVGRNGKIVQPVVALQNPCARIRRPQVVKQKPQDDVRLGRRICRKRELCRLALRYRIGLREHGNGGRLVQNNHIDPIVCGMRIGSAGDIRFQTGRVELRVRTKRKRYGLAPAFVYSVRYGIQSKPDKRIAGVENKPRSQSIEGTHSAGAARPQIEIFRGNAASANDERHLDALARLKRTTQVYANQHMPYLLRHGFPWLAKQAYHHGISSGGAWLNAGLRRNLARRPCKKQTK